MRYVSFSNKQGKETFGLVTEKGVIDVGARMGSLYPDLKSVIAANALSVVAKEMQDEIPDYALEGLDFLPTIPNPGKIICVGLNYENHRKETGRDKAEHPAIFVRFSDSQIGHNKAIIAPKVSDVLDYEGELAVIIGKGGRYIPKEDAFKYVAGYSCYNDATIRDWQRHTIQFTPGKNFPGTGAFGPYLVTHDEVEDFGDKGIRTILNGEIMQEAKLSDMIFDIPSIINYVSSFTPLSPGDVIATGTPGGVGFKRDPQVLMKPGDEVKIEVDGIGVLENTITKAS
jgi:2-keto-4-pentenoate hydratase/2-oxohepta-3-ene-1,7-dioic acid hydratase in catechol pathway